MKNSESQELKTVYINETSYSAEDEIDLITLAMVLVRRKVIIAAIFIICIALGVTKAFHTPRIYNYSTTLEIDSQIESPQIFLDKLQHKHIPQSLIEYTQSYPDDGYQYQIESSISNSNFVVLVTKGTEDQNDPIIKLIQKISQKAIQDHNHIFQFTKESLETRLSVATNDLKSFKQNINKLQSINDTNKGEAEIIKNQSIIRLFELITKRQNTIELLTLQLARLSNIREIVPLNRSPAPISDRKKIVVIVSAIAGIFLGVFTAFFAEFISKVKQRIHEEGEA